ncbi:MAG: GNAT family N-acetyltransferase [Oscillibacter sp.]|jgi:L-amino acid N-acyltransferase YncA|nr:GNAT family N-acetyltransferase [Oscillibacter sp.]
MAEELLIRAVTPGDAREILEIYAPYVRKTAITFEYEVPALEEFRARVERTLRRYPYLAAERGGALLGYAYTGPFVARAAYDWAAETSIYLREDYRKMGLGRALYTALEAASRAQNILNLNACIGCPETEDAYLTNNSAEFHRHLGYSTVGKFHQCGYKFGTWYDMVWMEKLLGAHPAQPAPMIPFPNLSGEQLLALGIRPAL